MCKDEEDIVGTVVRHMLTQVDFVFVADNLSTDSTPQILADIASEHSNLIVYVDDVVAYEQSKKMTALAHLAREEVGAEWIVPFDADEIWYSPFRSLGSFLDALPDSDMIVPANLYDHVATSLDDQGDPDPVSRIRWRRMDPGALPKVAVRWAEDLVIGMGNHDASYDQPARTSQHRLAIRHFPYRSTKQVLSKIRNGAEAYAATDLPEHYGAHWRGWGAVLEQEGPEAIDRLFRKWHWRLEPGMSLDIDGEIQPPLICDPVSDLPIGARLASHSR
jgi:glycosyltransferase involved in cell wall biosynthesis